jgi:hypothetical protein
MAMPKQVNIIPPVKLYKGPDALRGTGIAFIYTAYSDDNGKHFFVAPGSVGHESMISNANVIKAMLGPKYDELKGQLSGEKPVWDHGPDGQLIDTGKRRIEYDYWEIRKLTMDTNLYGRYGVLRGLPVVMLWQRPEGWENMLDAVLQELNIPENAVITAGKSEQFLVKDYLDERNQKKTLENPDIAPDEQERFKALTRYHTATGAEKEALRLRYGFGSGGDLSYPNTAGWSDEQKSRFPWKRGHWRTAANAAGVKGVFDYGEMKNPALLRGFREFFYEEK